MADPHAFPTERCSEKQLFPFPEPGRVVEETPPALSWLPVPGGARYTVTVRDADDRVVFCTTTDKNYAVPSEPLPPGAYTWDVETPHATRGTQTFCIAENAVRIPRVDAETLYDRIPALRPRHLFFAQDIPDICAARGAELCTLRRNIEAAYRDGIPQPPAFHKDENATPYREYFGRFRDFCDRNLVACALGYALLSDATAGAFAKTLLLALCDFSPNGPCSLLGPFGDEVGLSMARVLPSVFDLLHPLLDEKQRVFVARTVRAYGEQCFVRLRSLNYCENPGDSHAGRVPAYLGEAAMVLKDTGVQSREEAIEWLSYALEIYGGIFPYYGTSDGGWAEGTFYATSYTKWYLPFFCAVERFGGTRFLDRPFYQRLTQFFLHFADPAFENHPFGDGYWCAPEDAEWPGFFAQNPCRFYADRFGPQAARDRARESAAPELFLLHLLDVFLPNTAAPQRSLTGPVRNVRAFADAGFVSLHTDLLHTERDLCVIARASKFGSDSHRHPDQGSFALFYRGVALISPSGYFGRRYGTKHHREWLNSTRAHNAILIDGVGQPQNSRFSRGRIVDCRDEGARKIAVLDLSESYPMLRVWERTLILTDGTLVVRDRIEADHPVTVGYPLHTLSRPSRLPEGGLSVTRGGVSLSILPCDAFDAGEISDRFAVGLNEGEPEQYHVSMPQQYHILLHTQRAASHDLTVRFCIDARSADAEPSPTTERSRHV